VTERYLGLVQAYLRDGNEAELAEIGALRDSLVEKDVPLEDIVGMHEHAMLTLKDTIAVGQFSDFVTRTSACLAELMIAYSLADQRRKGLLERSQRLERERQRLESLGQMAGGIAHEFNNLLQPIMGMAELAIEDAEPGTELVEQLGIILQCARQAAAIVRGILTAARKQGPAPRPMPLAPLLKRTVQFLSAIRPRQVRLDLSITCGDDLVLCEEGELAQVLINLVHNAGDAMDGTGIVHITLQRQERQVSQMTGDMVGPSLLLVIADQGAGMPADVASHAFQPFFTTKPPGQGTGLGLSIVMAIVHGWNATLEIDTAPGAGTRVSISLPIASGAS
jgi:signal transduction histidine kinase